MADQFDHTRLNELFRGGGIAADQFDHTRLNQLGRLIAPLGGGPKSLVAAAISATSTVAGSVTAQKSLAVASIAATSSIAGAVGRRRPVTPAAISATSTVSATLPIRRALVPSAISATSIVSGSVTALKAIRSASIVATSSISGAVNAGHGLSAAISATSTVSGSVTARKLVVAAAIAATSSVVGRATALRKLTIASILATSTMSGALGALRNIQASSISATSSVAGSVSRAHNFPGAVTATSSVTGSVAKKGSFGDKFDHTRGGELFRGAGVAAGQFNHTRAGEFPVARNIVVIPTTKNVVPADAIIAYSIVTANLYRPQKPVGTGTITATSAIVGSIQKTTHVAGGDQFDRVRAGELFQGAGARDQFNHTRAGEFARAINVPVATTTTRQISGAIAASSSVAGIFSKAGKLTPSAINATSSVSGALRRQHGLVPAAIAATAMVNLITGGTYGEGTYGSGLYGQGSGGTLPVLRAIKPTAILATSSVSGLGFGRSRRVLPNAILAVSIVSGTPGLAHPVRGSILAPSTVAAILTGRRGFSASIIAVSLVSASLDFGSGRVSRGSIAANSLVVGAITLQLRAFSGAINARSTVSGRIVAGRGPIGSITATTMVVAIFFVSHPRTPGDVHRILDASNLPTGTLISTGVE